ncbi:MAG: hypothetical protein EOO24_49725 [Comamonadaceae bacterium]|nr:MAG: hypothetical protein EOO24_49725 [Comamonadaceae bacterium]
MPTLRSRVAAPTVLALLLLAAGAAAAQEAPAQLAPGFSTRAAASRLVVIPADMELYSISAGGVVEPRHDWTVAAQKNFSAALLRQQGQLGTGATELAAADADDFAEVVALHRAVAQAIAVHHHGNLKLPTKGDRLDWSLGDAVRPLRERTGADYALFTWLRDSYTSGERKAAMIGMALLGVVSFGGEQVGYASLVDLQTGRVVWHNPVRRMWGDLRDAEAANETVEELLKGFPPLQAAGGAR